MDKLATALAAIWSVIREPLMWLISYNVGENNGRNNLEAETKDKTLSNVAKVKRIRQRPLTDDDIDKLSKYRRK